jgi:hypothetical protein
MRPRTAPLRWKCTATTCLTSSSPTGRCRSSTVYQRILNVVANPRPFIKTKTYFGPDRRRNTNNAYIGPERRVGGEVEVMQQPSLLDKARSAV